MYDVAGSAKEWWDTVVGRVELVYGAWLEASPLQKLRLRPDLHVDTKYHRVEQRMVAMMVAALPEQIRRDVVAARQMSTCSMLFRLYTIFQAGGGSERTGLLRSLTELKAGSSALDISQAVRTWRRWLGRAEELRVALPDSLILMAVLGRLAESLAKLNGQLGYRLAAARQELQVDTRPTLPAIKDFAEYLQAEADEMVLMTGLSARPMTVPTAPGAGHASATVKALTTTTPSAGQAHEGADRARAGQQRTSVGVCRYWGSEKGCKKGEKCSFEHSWEGLPKCGRCFFCSAIGHGKKDCPYRGVVKTEDPAGKLAKAAASARIKQDGGMTAGGKAGGSEAPGSAEEASRDFTAPSPNDPLTRPQQKGVQEDPSSAESMMQEATKLLKALQKLKALKLVMWPRVPRVREKLLCWTVGPPMLCGKRRRRRSGSP